jgi:hypothetical protein
VLKKWSWMPCTLGLVRVFAMTTAAGTPTEVQVNKQFLETMRRPPVRGLNLRIELDDDGQKGGLVVFAGDSVVF